MEDYTTADLLRMFLLKFLDDADFAAYDNGTFVPGKFVDDATGAIEVDTTVGANP